MKLALVLSGGGLFGAWQAGAWRTLASRMKPDLVVGASAGALNGYAIAGGIEGEELCQWWLDPEFANFGRLPRTIDFLMERAHLRIPFALAVTDLLRMKPRIIRDGDVTAKYLAATCAIPAVLPQQRIDGRIYSDGGLLNPLPVWAAVELGATHIVALHVLPEVPSRLLRPFVLGFRRVAGHHPPLPSGVELVLSMPERTLGSMRDAVRWKKENIERWIEQGAEAAKNISIPNCLER